MGYLSGILTTILAVFTASTLFGVFLFKYQTPIKGIFMNNIPSMPQLGIYVSKIDPTLRITVTDVDIVDDDDDSPDDELFYLVRWIEGEDESDMSAMEFELDPVEWQAFVESEQLVFERDPYMDSVPENSNLAKIRDLLMKTKQSDRS